MQSYTLRTASIDDLEAMMKLAHDGLAPHAAAFRVWDQATEERGFVEHLKPEHIKIIQLDGIDIGYFKLLESDDSSFLEGIYLQRDYRSAGVGSCVIIDILQRSEKPLRLRVYKSNPAKRLYYRLGFSVVQCTDSSVLMEHANDA